MNNFSSLDCKTFDVQIRYLNAVNIDRLQPKGLISITAKLLIFAITIKIGFNTFMRFSVIIYLVQVISEWADTEQISKMQVLLKKDCREQELNPGALGPESALLTTRPPPPPPWPQ